MRVVDVLRIGAAQGERRATAEVVDEVVRAGLDGLEAEKRD